MLISKVVLIILKSFSDYKQRRKYYAVNIRGKGLLLRLGDFKYTLRGFNFADEGSPKNLAWIKFRGSMDF